jgi:hypothetical protein
VPGESGGGVQGWGPVGGEELENAKVGAGFCPPDRTGRAQKNRLENRSGESSKTNESERVDGGNDLAVISQDGISLSPALHQMILIELKHVAKVLTHLIAAKQNQKILFDSPSCRSQHTAPRFQ